MQTREYKNKALNPAAANKAEKPKRVRTKRKVAEEAPVQAAPAIDDKVRGWCIECEGHKMFIGKVIASRRERAEVLGIQHHRKAGRMGPVHVTPY